MVVVEVAAVVVYFRIQYHPIKQESFLQLFLLKYSSLFHVFRRHSTERSVGYLTVFITVGCGDQKTGNNGYMLSFAQQNFKYILTPNSRKNLVKKKSVASPPRVFPRFFLSFVSEYLSIPLRGSQHIAPTFLTLTF